MKKFLLIAFLIFSGCTKMHNSNEVSVAQTNEVLSFKTGVVVDTKKVIIKDNGNGMMSGLITGTVLGSLFGNGKGNVLSTLIGGLSGAYAGYELDKANGEELFIKLDDGENIVTIVKGINIKKGDRVRIIFEGRRVVRVEKL
ncbi:MAG: glycine zipper 2TM domain-containing protein [Nautiliaceae bacterium]